MLYGYKEVLDNRTASLVVAADTVEEYTAWTQAVINQTENRNWVETYSSNFLDAMRSETYKGYKHSVLAVYHETEEQRDAFWTEWNISEVKSAVGRDRQLDMLHNKAEETRLATETEEDRLKTIEERFGLDVIDPWDRRSEEEKEADRQVKEQMKKMREAGELSGDSFGGADDQRNARSRSSNNVPGAYGRTQAIDALKTVADPETDWENKTNEELAQGLRDAGVPDVNGVYEDDQVPQKAVEAAGSINVTDIQASRNEDGTFNISSVSAAKSGGEVDEVEKAAREAEHQASVENAKSGRRAFSPEDFAAVLRGDGSADAVVHVTGDNRQTRQADPASRPSLSEHAEQARKEHQEKLAAEAKSRRQQAQREADVKARGERDRGIFRGADLVEDEDLTPWDELPEDLKNLLDDHDLKRDALAVKNYPYNSELGGRALLPCDTLSPNGMRMVGEVNLSIEGSMTMNGPGVYIVSRKDATQDGYGIYARVRPAVAEEADSTTEVVQPSHDIWLVRIRAN